VNWAAMRSAKFTPLQASDRVYTLIRIKETNSMLEEFYLHVCVVLHLSIALVACFKVGVVSKQADRFVSWIMENVTCLSRRDGSVTSYEIRTVGFVVVVSCDLKLRDGMSPVVGSSSR